jgi:FkbM family methyltransferase
LLLTLRERDTRVALCVRGIAMRFYSQVGQDKYLLDSFFKGRRDGIFLDIGAYDGETFSNSLFFEETMGWTGLCVEPLPSAFARLVARRTAVCENVALADFEGQAEFIDCDAGVDQKMLSGLALHFDPRHVQRLNKVATSANSIQVPVTRLGTLLERHGIEHIDLCSLDTEGSEIAILESLDLERFDISLFTIENNFAESPLRDLMARKGYDFVARLQWDDVYKRSNVARLPRTTVICAVWHGDPDRWELLRGHQQNLQALAAPVDAVYVFDGGDRPPDWLIGKAISVQQSLTLYQAWNVALSMVETPLVMNLNLDDRLAPNAVGTLEVALLRTKGAAAVGGEWRVCYSQQETDAVRPVSAAWELPYVNEWPPAAGTVTRLGSGSGDRGTFGPAVMWRMDAHLRAPRYPYRMEDGTLLRAAGDSAWWRLLRDELGHKLVRLPQVIGNYHSHPGQQAEFKPNAIDEKALLRGDVQVSLL